MCVWEAMHLTKNEEKGWSGHAPGNADKGGGCIPAKAPTTTGAILPAAVSTEKNPCAVPVEQQTTKRQGTVQ